MTQTTVSTWVRQYRRDKGLESGPSTEQLARIKELEKEVAELRRSNEILKEATRFRSGVASRVLVTCSDSVGRGAVCERYLNDS